MVTTMDATAANCHASSTNAADDDDNHHLQEEDEESASLSQTTTTIAPPPLPPPLLPLSSKQVLEWSVEDVGRWLAANSFSAYTELFCDRHQIDGRVLVSLSAEDLRAEPLHLTVFGDIKRLCMAIEVLRKHAAAHSSSPLDNGSGSGSGSNSGEEGGGGGGHVMSNGGSALPHSRYSRQTMSSLGGGHNNNALLRGQKRLRQKPLPPPDFEISEGESEEDENAYQRFDAGGGGGSRFENDSPPPPPRSVTTNSSRSEDSSSSSNSSNSSSLSSASSTVSLTSLSRCYSDDCLESLDGSPCQHVNANSASTTTTTTTSTSAIPLNVYVQQQGSSRAIQAQIIPTMASSAQLANMAAYYQQQQQQPQTSSSSGTYHPQQSSSHHYPSERVYQQQQQQQQQTKLINRKSAAAAAVMANHSQQNQHNQKQMKHMNSSSRTNHSHSHVGQSWERYGHHGQHTSSTHHLQQAKHKKHHHHHSHHHHHHHHHGRDDDHHFKPERWKAIVALLYFFASTWVTAIVMVIVHDRVPDMDTYPPLPDILLDNLPLIPWAFGMCEFCGVALFTIWFAIIVFHKHRFILLRRMFSLFGSVFLLRCVTMLITSLSVPGRHLECKARPYGSWMERIHQAYLIWQGGGMSIKGVRTCGDYMFSGHTVVLTLLNFFITEYTPTKLYLVHTVSWVLNLFGIFFILAAHEHYSIDVFIAFYISTRLFLYYHTLANNRALYQRDRHRTRIWFPLFYFFESSVNGIVPNTFDVPWRGYQELLVRYLAAKFSAGFAFGVPGLTSAGGNGASLSIAATPSEEERKPLIAALPSTTAHKNLESVDAFEEVVAKKAVKGSAKKKAGGGGNASAFNSNGGNISSASSSSASSSSSSGNGGGGGGSGNGGRVSANGSVANSNSTGSKVKTQ